jgi:Diadenosine tetraphosphate (Ap4A) hydrolase and other HIT family hydrolases
VAFNDINPEAPIHFLVIPRKPIPSLSEAGDEDAEVSKGGGVMRKSKYVCLSC